MEQPQHIDMMEIIEDQHAKSLTFISSQLPVAAWYDIIVQETITDAILDRLFHKLSRIEI